MFTLDVAKKRPVVISAGATAATRIIWLFNKYLSSLMNFIAAK